ncbi:MAG: hypothetical protein IPK80_18765 [Nannocystis sp.]|nr:hypothetical protein [Nannocystis sp.]
MPSTCSGFASTAPVTRPHAAAAAHRADPSRLWRSVGLPAQRAAAPSPIYDPEQCRCFRDLAGLYVGTDECALAICVDDRPQASARGQAGAGAAVGAASGRLGRLISVLDAVIAGGAAAGAEGGAAGERGVSDFLEFLAAVERSAPEELEIHLIVDRRASCRAPAIRDWLLQRRRFHVHFASDHARWLARACGWLAFAEQRAAAMRAPLGTWPLEQAMMTRLREASAAGSFAWTRSADESLTNFARFLARRWR